MIDHHRKILLFLQREIRAGQAPPGCAMRFIRVNIDNQECTVPVAIVATGRSFQTVDAMRVHIENDHYLVTSDSIKEEIMIRDGP